MPLPCWTAPFPSSPSQSVLALPELLARIFEFLDDKDHESTALVCKTWSEESLNILWDDIGAKQLPTLFRLLAPVVNASHHDNSDDSDDGDDANLLMFKHPLHMKDWVAFDKYARRVRNLDCGPDFMDRVSPSLWLEICATRPRPFIFPNLRHLTCAPQPAVISFLASDDLKSMKLVGRGTHFTVANMQHALLHMQSRMKSLRNFTLLIDSSALEKLHPVLPGLLHGFSQIHSLTMSQEYLTPELTSVLASFPYLRRLAGESVDDIPIQTQMWPTSLTEGSFPSLKSLSVGAPFSRIIPCLPRMAKLVRVILWSFDFDLPDAYGRIIETVSSALSELEILDLSPSETSRPSDGHDHIKFSVLKPLLSLRKLTCLDIHHCHPFDLTCDNVISFLRGLPQLTVLQLNPCPALPCDPILNGADLVKIAPHCQRLSILGLYLDLRTVPIYDELVSFPSLAMFSYGASPLSSGGAVSVAIFLSRLLPECCKLDKHWWHQNCRSLPCDGIWEEASKLLPAFYQVRRDERRIAEMTALESLWLNI